MTSIHAGVSRTLNVTYLQPVRQGLTLSIECMLRSIGKRLCTVPSPLSPLLIDADMIV